MQEDGEPDMNPSGATWEERWGTVEAGLRTSWRRGLEKAFADPDLADLALRGELPSLPWVGGCPKRLKNLKKTGAMNYLAMWQGLRGEALDIDPAVDRTVTCTRTGMMVTFTSDVGRLFASAGAGES